jgi:hypothetical protein
MIKGLVSNWDLADLDGYYKDCVIGGVGSFMIPIHHAEQFATVIQTKILHEIAGIRGAASLVTPAQARADCLSGEKRRREEEALGGEGFP